MIRRLSPPLQEIHLKHRGHAQVEAQRIRFVLRCGNHAGAAQHPTLQYEARGGFACEAEDERLVVRSPSRAGELIPCGQLPLEAREQPRGSSE